MTAATILQSGSVPETPRPVLVGTNQDGEMQVAHPVLTGELAYLAKGGWRFLSLAERQFIVGLVSGRARRWAKDAEMLVVRLDRGGRLVAHFRRAPVVCESRALFNAWYVTNPMFDESMEQYADGGCWSLSPEQRREIVVQLTGRVQDWIDRAEIMMVHAQSFRVKAGRKTSTVRTLAVHFMVARTPPGS